MSAASPRIHSLTHRLLSLVSGKRHLLYVTAIANDTLASLTKIFYNKHGNPRVTNEMVKLMKEWGLPGIGPNSYLLGGTIVRMPAPPKETQYHLWCTGRSGPDLLHPSTPSLPFVIIAGKRNPDNRPTSPTRPVPKSLNLTLTLTQSVRQSHLVVYIS